MRIPEHTVEEIRAAADIVDVVSGFVRLRKAGRNFLGLCPFHQEKTPSFNVNPERQIYKCFGCGRGGNAFTFIMEMEKVSFVEAVTSLAERYHITIPADDGPKRETADALDTLYAAMRFAAREYHALLQTPAGEDGAAYIRRRGWTDDTVRRFGLGFASPAWDALLLRARAEGFTDDVLERAGLIIRKEGGRAYDRFRGRLIFPIFSASKKVVGFGARTLHADEEPKYLNSPETPIYVKSRILYGLSHAVQAIRAQNSVIIVEGYADALSLSQAGVENVVATSGTALTPEQVRMLTRYTRELYFLYDADSAGFSAMLRGLDLMLEEDCDPRIVTLPKGEDPDSFVRRFGADELRARLDSAVSFVDYVTARYRDDGALESPEGRTTAIRHIVSLLAKMDDALRRQLYVRHIAETYKIYESAIYDELEKQTRSRRRQRPADLPAHPPATAPAESRTDAPREFPKAEMTFCRLLLAAPREPQREALVSIRLDMFTDPRLAAILHHVSEQFEHDGAVDIPSLDVRLGDDPALHAVLADLLIERETVSTKWTELQTVTPPNHARALLDAYKRIVLQHIDRRRDALLAVLRGSDPDHPDAARAATDLRSLLAARGNVERIADFAAISRIDPLAADRDVATVQ